MSASSASSRAAPNNDTPGIIRLYRSKVTNASETSDKIKILCELHEKLLAHQNSQSNPNKVNKKKDNKKKGNKKKDNKKKGNKDKSKAPNQYSDTDDNSASSILSHLFLGSMNECEMDAAFDFIAEQLMKIKEHLVQLKTSVMEPPPMSAMAGAKDYQNRLIAAGGLEQQFDVLSELIRVVQGKTAIREIERAQLNQLCDDSNAENVDRLVDHFNNIKFKWAETEAMTKLVDNEMKNVN